MLAEINNVIIDIRVNNYICRIIDQMYMHFIFIIYYIYVFIKKYNKISNIL